MSATIVSPHPDLLSQMQPVLEIVRRWLIAYAILLARPMAILSINPVFTRLEMSNLIKGVIATGMVFPMWPVLVNSMGGEAPGISTLLLVVVKESLVGLAIGLPLGLPFWGLLAVGDIVDQQRGATQGRLNDPAGFGDESVTGTMLLLCGIMILVVQGRLDVVADTLYTSWGVWKPMEMLPLPGRAAGELLLHLLDQLEALALTLAMPIILVLLLSDGAMLLIARIAPQLKVDDLSMAVRNLVFFVFMPLYAGFLLIYAARDEVHLDRSLQILAPVLAPSRTGHALPGSAPPATP
ncbi:type III secretion system export apparatus subunit SctT [Rhizosaccharibacter radicis]|uniref:Type III secretion system export apparatus subunit SctT n=1 Tax=Rhizosaccharibacter radicis TaxID=2782605 RepID=A0ABT1VTE4_9PROT|nr:type III secretion system export apparatus subunit SctT [Acetobacteraceae bacterium KSS12]